MFRYKTKKQSVIIAAMIIILCLVCLTGATLALFTSNPNDGTIGVITTAGDIGIDIVDAYEGSTLVGQVLQFQTSASHREILFEPGATFYTQGFKLKNTGNIPINFRLSVSEDEKINMEEFYKAFEVWITDDLNDPTAAKRLSNFKGRLEVGQSSEATFYLFVKMKETAGHDFQGKSYDGIGITVYAVQGNVVQ